MITDTQQRAELVYQAEVASGIATLRPLASIHEAQSLVDYLIKRPYFRKRSRVRKVILKHVPVWERFAECGWEPEKPTIGDMELTIGSLCEGTVKHETGHLAKGDNDNGHGEAFLRLQFELLEDGDPSDSMGVTLLPRYAMELLLRDLVKGTEPWLRPWLLRNRS